MAFDPGKDKSICYVDGDVSDWNFDKPIYTDNNGSLYVKSDEKYVYLMLKTSEFDFSHDLLYIPIDTLGNQGNNEYKSKKIRFERFADFLIQIDSDSNSRILVDAYYDSFDYLYAKQLEMIEKNDDYSIKNNGVFNFMYHCLSREIYLPQDKKIIPFSKYETGLLKLGDANPEHDNYNSLTDFSFKGGNIEIKIPWQLLNVMDPSTKNVMSDLYKNNSIKSEKIDGMYFGFCIVKNKNIDNKEIPMKYYTWAPWELPSYHERLKPSYYILKNAFNQIN